ncbi:MAG: outer membrane beta-barrel protein [Sulfurovum sp.]|nr:outer membrane beta-barrel protein [Sulfurovum sp.]
MKKTTLSIVSILALSGLAFAGGDFAPVEPVVEVVVIEPSPFYLGLGIGDAAVNDDFTSEEFSTTTLMLQAGYQYNPYIAVEGRYTFGLDTDYAPGNTGALSSDYDGDFSSWGLYVKPMYPIGDFSLYALLGYGGVMLDDLAGGDAYESGFQWGLGAGYAVSEQFTVFVDYVSLYDDTGFDYRAQLDDVDSDTWTFGMSYRF